MRRQVQDAWSCSKKASGTEPENFCARSGFPLSEISIISIRNGRSGISITATAIWIWRICPVEQKAESRSKASALMPEIWMSEDSKTLCRRHCLLALDGWTFLPIAYPSITEEPQLCQQLVLAFIGRFIATDVSASLSWLEAETVRLARRMLRPLTPLELARHLKICDRQSRRILHDLAYAADPGCCEWFTTGADLQASAVTAGIPCKRRREPARNGYD